MMVGLPRGIWCCAAAIDELKATDTSAASNTMDLISIPPDDFNSPSAPQIS
jgi:hypothetical protein